jgi:hypothetical protein
MYYYFYDASFNMEKQKLEAPIYDDAWEYLYHKTVAEPLSAGELTELSELVGLILEDDGLSPVWQNCFTAETFLDFKPTTAVLGYWSPDPNAGIRYDPYSKMSQHHFASSTIGLPGITGAKTALGVCLVINQLYAEKKYTAIEQIIKKIVWKSFRSICDYYHAAADKTEILFDDNATMALFQWLSFLPLKNKDHLLTFFDTGRVLPDALKGINPEFFPANFRAVLDAFGNRTKSSKLAKEQHNIGEFNLLLIEHYLNEEHYSDSEITEAGLKKIATWQPKVILIPTITRLGRKIKFLELSERIKEYVKQIPGYDPWIVLDDAQGLMRMKSTEYLPPNCSAETHSWEFYDAILYTPAKVVGGLMGSAGILFNKQKFELTQNQFQESLLNYRARKYSLISTDSNRVDEYNKQAPGVVQAGELASAIIELREMEYTNQIDSILGQCYQKIVGVLDEFPEFIKVMKKGVGRTYIPSIVPYHFKSRENGLSPHQVKSKMVEFKKSLYDQGYIIPALVTPPNNELDKIVGYLRFAFNTKNCTPEYLSQIEKLAQVLKITLKTIFSSKE